MTVNRLISLPCLMSKKIFVENDLTAKDEIDEVDRTDLESTDTSPVEESSPVVEESLRLFEKHAQNFRR